MLIKNLVISLFVLICSWHVLGFSANAQEEKAIFKNKYGYFTAIAPYGWKQKNHPAMPPLSKVTFHHPKEKGTSISVIAGQTPSPDKTLEDIYQENKVKVDSLFREKYPNGKQDATKKTINGHQAIVHRNSVPEKLEQEMILFLNNNIWYSITYTAKTKILFDNDYQTFQQFLSGFVIQ